MSKGRPPKKQLPLSVVYRKSSTSKKYYMQVFEDIDFDSFVTSRKWKSLFPDNYVIEELGLGSGLVEDYKEKYNIKKFS